MAGSPLRTVTVSATWLAARSTPMGYSTSPPTVEPSEPISSMPTRSATSGKSTAYCGSNHDVGLPSGAVTGPVRVSSGVSIVSKPSCCAAGPVSRSPNQYGPSSGS